MTIFLKKINLSEQKRILCYSSGDFLDIETLVAVMAKEVRKLVYKITDFNPFF